MNPHLETLEGRAVPAALTPAIPLASTTPAPTTALVAPTTPVTNNLATAPATTTQQNALVAAATAQQLAALTNNSALVNGAAAGPVNAAASLTAANSVLLTPLATSPSLAGTAGDVLAAPRVVAILPSGPTVDAILATAQPPAYLSAAGFQGRLVFPRTGLQVRSPTLPGPMDQPPGLLLYGAPGSRRVGLEETPPAVPPGARAAAGEEGGADVSDIPDGELSLMDLPWLPDGDPYAYGG
jgi:hypothetical protein